MIITKLRVKRLRLEYDLLRSRITKLYNLLGVEYPPIDNFWLVTIYLSFNIDKEHPHYKPWNKIVHDICLYNHNLVRAKEGFILTREPFPPVLHV